MSVSHSMKQTILQATESLRACLVCGTAAICTLLSMVQQQRRAGHSFDEDALTAFAFIQELWALCSVGSPFK